MYSIDFFMTIFWSKHPYQITVRKLRIYERVYCFPRQLRVVNFVILESILSFWLAFFHKFFKWDLKFSLLSITNPRIFSSVTFSIVVLLKEKFENDSLKPEVRKWHLSALSPCSFQKKHSDIRHSIAICIVTNSGSFNKKKEIINKNLEKYGAKDIAMRNGCWDFYAIC